MRYWVDVTCTVAIDVNDPDVIRRPVENVDGWREALYPLDTRDKVLGHLAVCAVDGATSGQHLDGWADLAEDAVRMDVRGAHVESVWADQ